jgi:hypothetical protein
MMYGGNVGYLDAKVIDNQAEDNCAPYVLPKPGCVLALIIPLCGEALLKELVG